MPEPMRYPLIAIKLFPCAKCNWPLLVSSRSDVPLSEDILDTEPSILHCVMCDWRGSLPGVQAKWRTVVEWTAEIHSEHHMNKGNPST
jgi:hypothetical protein